MKTNFNQVINRHNTGSVKWDFIEHYLQLDGSDLLPMWVSDFDFKCPLKSKMHCIAGLTTAYLATANETITITRLPWIGSQSGTTCS